MILHAQSMTFGTRDSKHSIEQGLTFAPKFDEHGLLPVVAIDAKTHEPLMLAYMNEQSLKLTLELGEMVYWSRSRSELEVLRARQDRCRERVRERGGDVKARDCSGIGSSAGKVRTREEQKRRRRRRR